MANKIKDTTFPDRMIEDGVGLIIDNSNATDEPLTPEEEAMVAEMEKGLL